MQHSDRQRTTLLIAGLLILLLLALSLWAWTSGGGMPEGEGVAPGTEVALSGEGVAIAEEFVAQKEQLAREAIVAKSVELATTGSLRIELNYADGEPGADLLLLILDAGVDLDSPETPRLEGRSDCNGIYLQEDLAAGSYQVQVVQPIFSERPVEIVAGLETSVRIDFLEGYTISGEVVNLQGRPVAGADIWSGGSYWSTEPATRSDAQGLFRLRGIRGWANIGASAKGYAPSPMRRLDASPGAELEVQLVLQGAGGAVQGRVISHDGDAVQGALVVFPNNALTWRQASREIGIGTTSLQTLSDARGEFHVEGLPPTKIPVFVRAKGHGGIKEFIDVTAGGVAEVLLRLGQTGSLHGRVLDGAEQPVADARVAASPPGRVGSFVVIRSLPDGSYRLTGLTAGKTRVLVETRDKTPIQEFVVIEAGSDLEHDIRFPSGLTIEGMLLDHLDAPLTGWRIVAWAPGRDYGYAVSDGEGNFLFEGLAPGQAYRLQVSRPRQGFHCHEVPSVMAGSRGLVIRIPEEAMAEGSIRGRVVDWQGNAIVGMSVWYSDVPAQSSSSLLSREDGGFAIEGLAKGRYLIRLMSGRNLRYLPEIELAPGEDMDLGEIREAQCGSLSLSLVIPNGTRAGQVDFFDSEQRISGGVKLVDGALHGFPMRPGKHYLRVGGTGLSSRMHEVVITPGQETELAIDMSSGLPVVLKFEVDLSLLEPGVRLDLQILDDVGLMFSRESLGFSKDHFRHSGNYPPGTYTFAARYGDSLQSEGKFEVESVSVGETTLTITLR